MRPISKFIFSQLPAKQTHYLLTQHIGEPVKDFPNTGKTDIQADNGYIILKRTEKITDSGQFYLVPTLMLDEVTEFADIYSPAENPYKFYCDDLSIGLYDCVLVEFSNTREQLTLLFYKDMADFSTELYDRWLAENLETTVECNVLKILTQKKKQVICSR